MHELSVGLPGPLRELSQGLEGTQWKDAAWALGIVLVALVAGRVTAALALRAIGRWAARTETTVDDAMSTHLPRPVRWLLPLVALELVMPLLGLSKQWEDRLQHALLVAIIAGVGWLLVKVVKVVEDAACRRFDSTADDNLKARAIQTQVRGFRNVAVFVVVVLTLGFVLMTFEAVRQVGTGLLASAGVAGLVLGFAAQRSLATLLAGIQIALSQPIRIDDVVIVEGEWGRIEEIHLTYVVVRIWDLRRLIVPVNYFIDRPFQNWTRTSAEVLGTVNLYCDYSVPVAAIRQELERILAESELWDGKVWSVQVTDASERAMLVRPLFSARNSSDQWNLRCEVREKLIAFLQREYPGALPRLRGELRVA
ncbi:MAG: mechanosensitive ion channel [Polyangiaceae bacterium]|nr:mechanosensitive ion channel [Polyangiaceae bacterium]MCL4749307.1 mechanosensitive ion channel family protein [Myxococcales bacterium]